MRRGGAHTAFSAVLMVAVSSTASASIEKEYYRAPEAAAMGNAYVAIVEDEHAIYYNPAGVAGYEHGELHLAALDFTAASEILDRYSTLKNLNNPNGSDLNKLMGTNIYADGRVAASLMGPHWGVSTFYDAEGAVYPTNQAIPKIEFGYQRTGGVQGAFGFSLKDGRARGKGKHNGDYLSEWRFGVGGKYISRLGGYRVIPTSQLITLDKDAILDLYGQRASNYGFDLGMQRVQRINPLVSLMFGAAWQNIGDIAFEGGADALRQNLSVGTGFKFQAGIADVTLAYDIRQITAEDDWRKKNHVGVRVGLPLFDLYAGYNQAYFTYGASMDIWLLKLTAVSYREETGSYVFQDPERRYALRIDLKFPM